MGKIKVGVQISPQHADFADYRRAWRAVDDLGVDSIWTWDHFFPVSGASNGNHFEGWTLLAALGVQTKRADVGSLVLSLGYRNPALLSAMAKTLDHALGGRLILGVGAGWYERDYVEYGYEFGTAASRLRNLERGIRIIRDRWQKDQPKPVEGTIPILIGGGGEKATLRITALHADLWNTAGPPERWSVKNEILDEWCSRVGRERTRIERTAAVGSEDLERLDDYVAVGATHLIFKLVAPFDLAPVERMVVWRDLTGG